MRQVDLQRIAFPQQVDGAGVGAIEQDALRQVFERDDHLAADALLKAQEVLDLIAASSAVIR